MMVRATGGGGGGGNGWGVEGGTEEEGGRVVRGGGGGPSHWRGKLRVCLPHVNFASRRTAGIYFKFLVQRVTRRPVMVVLDVQMGPDCMEVFSVSHYVSMTTLLARM